MPDVDGLWGLFLASLISSTLFPGGSEIVLAYLNSQNAYPQWLLLTVATTGNTLGAISTWLIGRLIAWRFPENRLFKPRQQAAIQRIKRWGTPALLFSWLPVIGDPLCLAAGWLRTNIWLTILFITTGKGIRYFAIIYLTGD